MKTLSPTVSLLGVLCVLPAPTHVYAQQQGKPVPVILSVEGQGSGGIFMGQIAKDLSPTELRQFRSLIEGEIGKLSNHKIVPADYKDDAFGVAVVVEKLQCGGTTYLLTSSALTIATAAGTDLLVTHDVLALPSLAASAHAIVGQLVNIELRRTLGMK